MKPKTLNLTSKVKQLLLYDLEIDKSCSVEVIDRAFKENPNLPGAIITEEGNIIGVIPRKKYNEYMSRPYSLELCLTRSISYLCKFIKTDYLLLPGKTSITKAMQKVIQRSLDLREDPIAIEISPQEYRLLDLNQLTIAHSEIQIYAKHLITKLYKEIKTSNKKFKELATIDGLTGVSNRRKFDECLQQEWRRSLRQQIPISLILSDVDCFKSYNDTYGHQAGDSCLRAIAKAMKDSVRRPGDLVARYGGEEFAILLPNTETNGAISIAQQIRQNIADLKIEHSKSIVSNNVTVSLGIVTLIPQQNRSAQNFIVSADLALYRAKKTGRNRYVIYTPELDDTQSDTKISPYKRDNVIKQADWLESSSAKENDKPIKFSQKMNNKHIIDLIRLATVRANLTGTINESLE